MTRLGDVLMNVKPGFATSDDLDEGVFQFRMHNFTRDGALDLTRRRRVNATAKQMEMQSVAPGDILFNATNSPELVGKSALIGELDEPAVFSNHFMRLRTDPAQLDPRYLAHFLRLQFGRRVFQALAKSWVNQATIGRDRLEGLDIPTFPLTEQRRIAAILDHADALRAKRRQVLTHLDALTQSIFVDIFSGKDWPTSPLAKVVRTGTLVTYGIVQAGPEFDRGVPYIRTGDIVDGRISTAGLRHTDPAIAARFERSTVRAGDIVMSIRATVGTTAVIPPELDGANLTQGTARIAPSDLVIGPYLLECLRSPEAQHWIQRQIKGATFREITLGRLRELEVPVPPTRLQEEFAFRVNAVNAAALAAHSALAADTELFSSLQSRAFRGEL